MLGKKPALVLNEFATPDTFQFDYRKGFGYLLVGKLQFPVLRSWSFAFKLPIRKLGSRLIYNRLYKFGDNKKNDIKAPNKLDQFRHYDNNINGQHQCRSDF